MRNLSYLVVLPFLLLGSPSGYSQVNDPNGPPANGTAMDRPHFKSFYVTLGINYIDTNTTNDISVYDDNFSSFKSAFALGVSKEVGQSSQIALDVLSNTLELLGDDRFLIQTSLLYNYDVVPFLFGKQKFFKLIAGSGIGYYHLEKEHGNMLISYNTGIEFHIAKGIGLMAQHRGNIGVFNKGENQVNNFNQMVFGIVARL
ncbi:hypothetical protein [Flagellimonas marinaquae]